MSKSIRKERINLTGATEYQLGIIFGIGSYIECEHSLLFRHNNRYFIERIECLFDSVIYKQYKKEKEQYVLKTCIADIKSLESIGWSNRNADVRHLPKLTDYKDFLRAYIELHGILGYCTSYKGHGVNRKKYYRLRLRIYGNINIIESINNILVNEVDVKKKAIQIVHNNKTAYIAYASLGEIEGILEFINGDLKCENWWNDVKDKLKEPTKETLGGK